MASPNTPNSKAAQAARQQAALGTQAPDSAQVAKDITALDEELAALKARFDQYFLGIERINPAKDYEDYKKRLLRLKGQFHRNTAVKFRLNTLQSKFMTYERLWLKTLRDIEEGRYVRDLRKLKRKNEQRKKTEEQRDVAPQGPVAQDQALVPPAPPRKNVFNLDELEADLPEELFSEAAAPLLPAVASHRPPPPPPAAARPPPPPTAARPPPSPVAARPPPPPAAARPPPPPGPASDGLSDEKIGQIYDAYMIAKRRCRENTDGITPAALAQSLRKQVPKLMEQHGVKTVDFKVVIKDGRAILKAVPK